MLCGSEALLRSPPKSLVGSNATHKTVQMTHAQFGPFEDKVAACKYCFGGHTKSLVLPNCICSAYDGPDGPTAMCTATAGGVSYTTGKDGSCKCVEKNMAKLGATTCDPWE